jgi:putative transposase
VLLRWLDEGTPQEHSLSATSQSLSHARWHCKYHVVFVPKRRRQRLYGNIRQALGTLFHALARQNACRIIAGHFMPDHVHIGIEIPPKQAVAAVSGFLKGQSASASARQFRGRERHFTGEHFWARGSAVSTVGFELEQVRAYIRAQDSADEEGRFSCQSPCQCALVKTHTARATAFEAALLIKPPAFPGVSDVFSLSILSKTCKRFVHFYEKFRLAISFAVFHPCWVCNLLKMPRQSQLQ